MDDIANVGNLPELFGENAELILETVKRIQATMEKFGYSIIFSGNTAIAYRELMEQLIPAIQQLFTGDKPRLMRLLYTVDISEKKLNSFAASHPMAAMAGIIAHLVIEREFQKVLTRRHFR